MRKRFKILLGVSLLVNILFIGLVGGHIYHKTRSHPWHEAKKELSPEVRNIVGRNFQTAFRDIRPKVDQAKKARAALLDTLTAENFDEEKFDRDVERLMAIGEDIQLRKVEAIKEIAKQVPTEERQKMAEKMSYFVGGGYERKVHRPRKPLMIKPPHKPEH